MPISKDLKDRAQKTREDGVFTLKLDKGVSLAALVSFAQDMFPGVSTDISAFGRRTMASSWSRCTEAEAFNRTRVRPSRQMPTLMAPVSRSGASSSACPRSSSW